MYNVHVYNKFKNLIRTSKFKFSFQRLYDLELPNTNVPVNSYIISILPIYL